jgi:phosphoglucomutase / phosphopentomutase
MLHLASNNAMDSPRADALLLAIASRPDVCVCALCSCRAIGWDHRAAGSLSSERFALLAAEVLLRRGITVSLMDNLVHTPLVPFCVLRRGCKAGIMITASHNPKEDNGYKVYWGGTGAQIIPPHDSGIASCIEANLQPWASYGVASLEAMLKAEWAAPVGCYTEELSAAYYRGMAAQLCCHPVENAASTVKIVHTAMHGVGHQWTVRAFEAFGLPPPTPV